MEKKSYIPSSLSASAVSPELVARGLEKEKKLRVLRLPEVISRVGLKRASIYRYINNGAFPRPVSLGPRAVGWVEQEIDAWLADRIQVSLKCRSIQQ